MSGLFGDGSDSYTGYGDYIPATSGIDNSDVLIVGEPNSLPTVSDTPEAASSSGWDDLKNILGSIGTTARDVGTAVGTAQANLKNAGAQYKAGQQAASNPNTGKLQTWWLYSSSTDKLMVGLAVAALAVAIYQVSK